MLEMSIVGMLDDDEDRRCWFRLRYWPLNGDSLTLRSWLRLAYRVLNHLVVKSELFNFSRYNLRTLDYRSG